MDPEKLATAARQIERHARHAESTGGETGKAKSSGYRHAMHVLRVMGGVEIPSPQALAASLQEPDTLPGLSMAASA